jgi:Flp pilus assembly protein TadG
LLTVAEQLFERTMFMNTTMRRLAQKVLGIGRDRRGNVAITFGFAMLPIIGLVGAGIDYSHAISIRVALQAGLDSTALMLSKQAASLKQKQLQSTAQQYFNGVFQRPEAQNVSITANYTTSGGSQVTVDGSAAMTTSFMQILGYNTLTVTGTSTVKWGMSKLRVALVLDNTGSMAQSGKMPALQTASHQLLQQLQNASTNPNDVQVAIVPFTTDVNIGNGNKNNGWLKWSYSGTGPFGTTTTVTIDPATWSGCVTDRDQNFDVQNSNPAGSTAAEIPADNPLFGCPPQIMPLGNDWTGLNNLIDQMKPLGETNLTIGLVWGWQALSTGVPLNAPGLPPNTNQAVVFMTDGFNTANRWNNVLFGSGTTANIDARTALVCTNIKAAGITIYTIQVDTGGDSPPSTLLQNCASDTSKWFYLQDPNQLVTVFSQIGTALSQLYIAN